MKYSSSVYLFILAVLAAASLYSCASTGSPSGGPRDKTPPGLVEDKSSPNYSTNYSPKKIELVFDEWIELRNQKKEILISPPFFKSPKVSFRGKRVKVEFPEDEPLRPDATYTINFGKSIVDFTESNPLEGFRFLFATGDKIDSLTFSGNVVDAYGGDPVKDVLVMLYDVLGDSVVLSEKPFYYTRAADEGKFTFENVKNDTFKLVVIEDLNLNYLLDDEVERLAFMDSTFFLTDSTDLDLSMRLFLPEQRLRVLSSSSKVPGVITVVFNKPADGVSTQYLYPDSFVPLYATSGDTARYYFSDPIDSVGLVFDLDTLDFTIRPFDSLFYAQKLRLIGDNRIDRKLAPFDSLMMRFGAPLREIDTTLIMLSDLPVEVVAVDTSRNSLDTSRIVRRDSLVMADSLRMLSDSTVVDTSAIIDVPSGKELLSDTLASESVVLADSLRDEQDTLRSYTFATEVSGLSAQIINGWKPAHDYRLTILPGAIVDIYGRTTDTIVFDFVTSSPDEFGAIDLTVAGLDSTLQYLVLLRQGDKVIKRRTIDSLTMDRLLFKRLPVNTYNIHLIRDENRDEKWTTGDYWQQRQPELLRKFELEKLRENWDLEATISWDASEATIVPDSLTSALDSLGQMPLDSTRIIDGQERIIQKENTPKSGNRPTPRGRGGKTPNGRGE